MRSDLERLISAAQADLSGQLADLQRAGQGDDGVAGEIQNQLTALKSLSQGLSSSTGASLAQMRGDVLLAVASSSAVSQQARTATDAARASSAGAGSYAQATAALDARVAATMEADRNNNALAHDVAQRGGIDLSAYDQERADLEAQRKDAIARGDKAAERQADLLIAQNTLNTMQAGADSIKDPEERRRYEEAMADERRVVTERKAALEAQLGLEAQKIATEKGMSPKEAEAFVAQYKAEGMAASQRRTDALKGTDQEVAASRGLEAERIAAMATIVPPSTAETNIHESLSPEAKAAAKAAVAAITGNYGAAAASSGFEMSLDAPQVALSTAQDAHTTVVVPTANGGASPSPRGQTLA